MKLLASIQVAHKGMTKEVEYININGKDIRMTDESYADYREYTKAIDYLLDEHTALFSLLKRIRFI